MIRAYESSTAAGMRNVMTSPLPPFSFNPQYRAESAVVQRHLELVLRASLQCWRGSTSWRRLQRRVQASKCRYTVTAWRLVKETAVGNRRVARKGNQVQLLKCTGLAWRRWICFCEAYAINRRNEGIARCCLRRSWRIELVGSFGRWKGLATMHATDQRIQTLSVAVESYDQALQEVTDEVRP